MKRFTGRSSYHRTRFKARRDGGQAGHDGDTVLWRRSDRIVEDPLTV
jgi:hypothetical protein